MLPVRDDDDDDDDIYIYIRNVFTFEPVLFSIFVF